VDLLSAASESRLDEADLAAQHVRGFPAQLGLASHKIEESLPFDVHNLRVGNCKGGQTIRVPRKGSGNPQKESPTRIYDPACPIPSGVCVIAASHGSGKRAIHFSAILGCETAPSLRLVASQTRDVVGDGSQDPFRVYHLQTAPPESPHPALYL
jgi:hypothetical protein